MGARERIISIRLIEMIHRTPEYADEIGIKGEILSLKNANKKMAGAGKLSELATNKRMTMSEEGNLRCVNMQ